MKKNIVITLYLLMAALAHAEINPVLGSLELGFTLAHANRGFPNYEFAFSDSVLNTIQFGDSQNSVLQKLQKAGWKMNGEPDIDEDDNTVRYVFAKERQYFDDMRIYSIDYIFTKDTLCVYMIWLKTLTQYEQTSFAAHTADFEYRSGYTLSKKNGNGKCIYLSPNQDHIICFAANFDGGYGYIYGFHESDPYFTKIKEDHFPQ